MSGRQYRAVVMCWCCVWLTVACGDNGFGYGRLLCTVIFFRWVFLVKGGGCVAEWAGGLSWPGGVAPM